jgi:hypothetical protein
MFLAPPLHPCWLTVYHLYASAVLLLHKDGAHCNPILHPVTVTVGDDITALRHSETPYTKIRSRMTAVNPRIPLEVASYIRVSKCFRASPSTANPTFPQLVGDELSPRSPVCLSSFLLMWLIEHTHGLPAK